MKGTSKKTFINNYIDILCFALSILYSYIKLLGDINTIFNVVYLIILYSIFFYRILSDKKLKAIIIYNKNMILIGVLVFLFSIVTNITTFSMYYLLIIILSRHSLKEIIKYYFVIMISLFLMTMVLNFIGVIEDPSIIRMVDSKTYYLRRSFGFGNPNVAFLIIFSICLSFNYIYYDKIFADILTIIVLLLFYYFTRTRTGLLCVILFFAFKYLFRFFKAKKVNINKEKIIKILKHSFLIFTLLTVLCVALFNITPLFKELNRILSDRLLYWNNYLNLDLIFNFLGNPVVKGFPLDNTYLFTLRKLGLIAFFIINYIFFLGIKKSSLKDLIFITIFMIYGMFEYNLVLVYNFSLLLIFINIFRQNKIIKTQEKNQKKIIKVLHIGMSNNLGGIEKYIMDLYNNIDSKRIRFDFLVNGLDSQICYQDQIDKKISKLIHIESRDKNYLKFIRELKEVFSKSDYDYIHIHLMSFSYFEPILFAYRYGNAKIILHSHINQFPGQGLKTKLFDFIGRHIVKNIPTYKVACSRSAWKYMFKNFYNLNSIKVFNNGIDSEKFVHSYTKRIEIRDMLGISDDTFVIGNVGRMTAQKNPLFLVDIFSEIIKINPDSRLLMIGQGELLPDIKKRAVYHGVIDKIIFTGVVSNVNDYMQAMDAFVFPTLYEGLGIVLIEAQASGLKTYTSSENVPIETKITDLIYYISLNRTAKEWAKIILKEKNYVRKDMKAKLLNSNFDLKTSSKSVWDFYSSNL